MRNDHDNGTISPRTITPPSQHGDPTIDGPDPDMFRKKNEHMARGIAHKERGEYVKAIDEFAAACQLDPRSDYGEECYDELESMLFVLFYFFNPDGDPDDFRFWEGEEPVPEATLRELAAKTIFPPGYLVTGGDYVFASHPLTKEGRTAAIEHARRLAHEGWRERYEYPGTILGDVPDFHMFVYRHENRPEEICRFQYDS